MQGIDSINIQVRPNLIYTEGGGPSLRILPEQGKLLNLKEGQIINSSVALRPEGNVIQIAGRNVLLPLNFARPGDGLSLKVSMSGEGYLITRTIKEPTRQSFKETDVTRPSRKRLMRLLNSNNAHQAREVFGRDFLNSLYRTGASSEPLGELEAKLVPVSRIDGRFLRYMMEKTGVFTESALKKALPASELNLKALLAEIRKLLRGLGRDVSVVNGALDELESSQLDVLAGNLNRQAGLNWVIPFLDAPPVHVRIYGEPDRADSNEGKREKTWIVELNLQLGGRECIITISQREFEIDLSCWVQDIQIYERMTHYEADLRKQMLENGLDLRAFNVFWGDRDADKKGSLMPSDSSFEVDRRV